MKLFCETMTYFLRIALPFLPRMQFEQRTRHIKPAMRYSSVFFASIVAGSLFRSFEVRRSLLHHKLAILGVDDAEDLLFLARLGADVDDVFFLAAGSLKLIAKPFGLGRNGDERKCAVLHGKVCGKHALRFFHCNERFSQVAFHMAEQVISMARSNDYDSASSQFFIVQEDSDFLDGQYACFGYVTEGMEIVDAICEAAEPIDEIGTIATEAQPIITSIEIREKAQASSSTEIE